jgi:hypothetical protein
MYVTLCATCSGDDGLTAGRGGYIPREANALSPWHQISVLTAGKMAKHRWTAIISNE